MANELLDKVIAYNLEIKTALQLLYDNVNKGQQKQLVKRAEIKALFDRYGVECEE